MTTERAATLAASLDAILDSAIPGDDHVSLELVRMASRRMHGFIAKRERESMGKELENHG